MLHLARRSHRTRGARALRLCTCPPDRRLLFFLPFSALKPACTANFCVFFFYRLTRRPRRTSLPLMMMSFICSCRNKNQPNAIYPKGTSHHTRLFRGTSTNDMKSRMVLAAPGPLLTPPSSSSPQKTPNRSPGMPSQRNQSVDSFRFKRAAFYQSLKSKVGLAASKAAALRINLNVEDCGIVAAPVHAQSPFPPRSLVHDGQTSPHRPRLVVTSL